MQESNQELFDDFEEELYEHYRFEAGKGQSPLRVDKFLMNLIENATRNKIQQAAANGNIYVNDVPVKSNHKVKSQDVVRVLMKQPPFENIIIPENIQLNIVYEDEAKGKWAVTHYKVLERFGYVTLVSCRLETGRTHQIRVHMKYIGHTLFNDERYGGHLILKGTTFTKYKQFVENCFQILPRQALHAKTLGFEHPVTKEYLRLDSEIPQDMQECIEKWRNYAHHSSFEYE
jgi:23S rRNA-/tRNA-specific pseudouridylate synthase